MANAEPAKALNPAIQGRLPKPRLFLRVRVPADVDVVTTVVPVPVAHQFDSSLNGVMRQASIDLTTARAGATLRNPGAMSDDDTCCCVRG